MEINQTSSTDRERCHQFVYHSTQIPRYRAPPLTKPCCKSYIYDVAPDGDKNGCEHNVSERWTARKGGKLVGSWDRALDRPFLRQHQYYY